MPRILSRARVLPAVAAAVVAPVVISLACTGSVYADPAMAPERQLADSIHAPNIKRHLEQLQTIADANGGIRAAGTPGQNASRDYVAEKLRGAGYLVTVQEFDFPFFQERSTAAMEQIAPDPKTYRPTPPNSSEPGDFATLTYSGSGETKATVQAVNLTLPPGSQPNSSASGCTAADFAGFGKGNIALVQRGTCSFGDKARNAQAAGASGVIVFNEGQPGRTDAFTGTLGGPGITIPVVGASFAVGQELAAAKAVIRLKTDTESTTRKTSNVVAETGQGDADKVVMAGAHLDSVLAGPGIDDNGSGSAGLLEVALRLAGVPTRNKVRFAWWSAEELGLLGSDHYVKSLSDADRKKIGLYLNFDMIASPNFAYKIHDGAAGPAGSAEIEKTFADYFDFLGLPHVPAALDGRSDYGPFMTAGIPVGGLFTGAEGIKTPEEQEMFGGEAGKPYDPCYHSACDTVANIDDTALTVNTAAIAYSIATFAFSENLPGAGAAPEAASQRQETAVVESAN
ncbi:MULTISPECIES: M28 family metallopeptidase [unclassified Nocardia]|uniref:M28 family metallopeptidase n=1 Tax=unclassified Nocardia TaxID=2637762 RepID=UPI001CE4846E|nr:MULTISPECIES: M28 family metallopeptidase [unclassified Nocardia]